MAGRRCIYDSSWLVVYIRSGDAAQRIVRPIRMHYARRPIESTGGRDASGIALFPGLDRIRKRIAAHPGCHAAGRDGAASSASRSHLQIAWHSNRNVFDVGVRRREIPDIEATVAHAKACKPDVCFTTVSYPIKGTPYYQRMQSRLVTLGEWNKSTDRDIRIQGRHSRRFYQYADELLKSELSPQPDPMKVQTARQGLEMTRHEVEA